MAYVHTTETGTYYLHGRDVQFTSRNKPTFVYYFTKEIDPENQQDVPEDKEVVVNKRTGIPFLKTKKK